MTNAFFNPIERPRLILADGRILESGKKPEEYIKPEKTYFLFKRQPFCFTLKVETLQKYDKDFFDNYNLERVILTETQKAEEESKEELKKQKDELSINTALSFIVNYAFKCLYVEDEGDVIKDKMTKSTTESSRLRAIQMTIEEEEVDEIERKYRMKRRDKEQNILINKIFQRNHFLVLDNVVYSLEKTSSTEEDIQVIIGTDLFGPERYNLKFFNTLESLDILYKEEVEKIKEKEKKIRLDEIKKITTNEGKKQKLQKKHYREPGQEFGFEVIEGEYYVTLKVPPHAYRYDGAYYTFEETEVALHIPVNGKNIGQIPLKPRFLNQEYIHPSKSRDKTNNVMCFDPTRSSSTIRQNIKIKIEEEKQKGNKDHLYHIALAVRYILKNVTQNCMLTGYALDGNPYLRIGFNKVIDDLKKTEDQYKKWKQKKVSQGFETELRDIHE